MPKDHWKNSTHKATALKSRASNSSQAPKFKKLHNPVTVRPGTLVLVRRGDDGAFKSHITTKQLTFTHFRAASKKALMFVNDGWSLWVSKRMVGYK